MVLDAVAPDLVLSLPQMVLDHRRLPLLVGPAPAEQLLPIDRFNRLYFHIITR